MREAFKGRNERFRSCRVFHGRGRNQIHTCVSVRHRRMQCQASIQVSAPKVAVDATKSPGDQDIKTFLDMQARVCKYITHARLQWARRALHHIFLLCHTRHETCCSMPPVTYLSLYYHIWYSAIFNVEYCFGHDML